MHLIYKMSEINYRTIELLTNIPINNNTVLHINQQYPSLNSSGTFHKSVAKLYYKKIIKKWLYDDLKSLLALVRKNKEGKIEFIKSYSDYDTSKLNILESSEIEDRINYLKQNLITKHSVKKIIKKLIENNSNINWTNIQKSHNDLKKAIKKYYEKTVEKALHKI